MNKTFAACLLAGALGLTGIPGWAQVCLSPILPGLDSDQDGFPDVTECADVTLKDGTLVQMNAASKDVFIILTPAPVGSLLPAGFNPYVPGVTYNGITFRGLQGLPVNPIVLAPGQANDDRTVLPNVPQKAISIAESTDVNGSILGNCQWGTPDGLDGCVVFTQRIMNFINSVCDSAGDRTSDRQQIFLAYITESFLHETGHTLGGMTSTYNSRAGGYHYKSGSGVVMEQSVTYATKGGKCTFYISSGWNSALDPTSIQLVP